MSQVEPIKATFSRDEIEKRINESFEREGVNNREFIEEPSIQDLMYDELRNLNGALASIDERICETNSLLHDIRSKQVNTNELRKVVSEDEHMTQEDIDDYMNSVKDHYVLNDEEPIMKRVKFSKNERHIIYKALGSRASTLRNQMGYNRINDDDNLKEEIVKHEKLIHKLKNS